MGICGLICGCCSCCKKKKVREKMKGNVVSTGRRFSFKVDNFHADSESDEEPTEEELRAKEIEEAERDKANRQGQKNAGDGSDSDFSSDDSDDARDEILDAQDDNVLENYCTRDEFAKLLSQARNKVFYTEIFNLVDDANETPEHCLYNWGRPRRWHVDVKNITAENITDQILPEVFFHISIGGPVQITECMVEDKGLYQLGQRGMVVRTKSRKHWSPSEIQIFREEFQNDKHIASYEDISEQCLRVEMWMLAPFGLNAIHSHAVVPLQELLRGDVEQSISLDSYQMGTPTVKLSLELVFAEVFDFALRPIDWWVQRDKQRKKDDDPKQNMTKNVQLDDADSSGEEGDDEYLDDSRKKAKDAELRVQFLQYHLPKEVCKRWQARSWRRKLIDFFLCKSQVQQGALAKKDWVGEQTVYTCPVPLNVRVMNCNPIPKSNRKADLPDMILFRGTNEQIRKKHVHVSYHEGVTTHEQFGFMLQNHKVANSSMRKLIQRSPPIASTTITLDDACRGVSYREPLFHQKHQLKKFGEIGGFVAMKKQPRFQQATVLADDLGDGIHMLSVKCVKVESMDPPDQRDPMEINAKCVVWFNGEFKTTKSVRTGLTAHFDEIIRFPVPEMEKRALRHQCIYVDVMLDDAVTQQHVGMLEVPLEEVFINPMTGEYWDVVHIKDMRRQEAADNEEDEGKKQKTYEARVAYIRRKLSSTFATRPLETMITVEVWTDPIYECALRPPSQYYSDAVRQVMGERRVEFHAVAEGLMVTQGEHATREDSSRWFQFEATDERGISWLLPKFLSRVRSTLTNSTQISHYASLLKFSALDHTGQCCMSPRLFLQTRKGSTLDHSILHASLLLGAGDPFAIPLVCLGTAWDGSKVSWVAIIRFEKGVGNKDTNLVVEFVDTGMRRSFILRNRFAHPQHMKRVMMKAIPATRLVPITALESEEFRRKRVVWQRLRHGSDTYKPLMLDVKQHPHPLTFTTRNEDITADSVCIICDKYLFDVQNGVHGFTCKQCLETDHPVFVCWLCAAAVYLRSTKYRNPTHQEIAFDVREPVQFAPADEVVLPYRTIDTVFSESGLWINLQHKSPAHIFWDLGNPTYWMGSMRGIVDLGASPHKPFALDNTFSSQFRYDYENAIIPAIIKAVSNARTERRLITNWNQDPDLTRYLSKGLLLLHQIHAHSKDLQRYSPSDPVDDKFCCFLLQQWRTPLFAKVPLGHRIVAAPLVINDVDPTRVADAVVRKMDWLVDTRMRNPQFTAACYIVCMPNYVVVAYIYLLVVHPLTTWQHDNAAARRKGLPAANDAMLEIADSFHKEPTVTEIPRGVQDMQRYILPKKTFTDIFPNFPRLNQKIRARAQNLGIMTDQNDRSSTGAQKDIRPARQEEFAHLGAMDFEMHMGDLLEPRVIKAKPLVSQLLNQHISATKSKFTNEGALSEWWGTIAGADIEFMTSESDELTTALVSDTDGKHEPDYVPNACVIGNSWIRTFSLDGWEKGALCYYWELEIAEFDDELPDHFGIGISQLEPSKITQAPKSADFFVPSFVLYFDGNFWNSNTKTWERVVMGYHHERLERGFKLGVLITPSRQFILFVNDKPFCFVPAQCPGKGRLYPVAELLGSVNAITLQPFAVPPKWCYPKVRGWFKERMKDSKIQLSEPTGKDGNFVVASYGDGSAKVDLAKKGKELFSVAFTDSPLDYQEDGRRYFEIVVEEIAEFKPKEVKLGMCIGVTLCEPADIAEVGGVDKAIDVPLCWLVGFDGKQFDGVRQSWSFNSWNPLQMKKGSKIGIVITLDGHMLIYVDDVLMSRGNSDIPSGQSLYGVVDLLGPFQRVRINPKAVPPEPELAKWSPLYRGHQVKIKGSRVETYASQDGGSPPSDSSWAIGDGVLKRYKQSIFFECKITVNDSLADGEKNMFSIGVASTKTVVADDSTNIIQAFNRVCFFRFDGTFYNSASGSKHPVQLPQWTPPALKSGDRICVEIDGKTNMVTLYVNSDKEVTGPTPFPGYNFFPTVELLGTVESVQLLIGESPPTIRCSRWNGALCGQRCQISSDGKTATFSSLAAGTSEEKISGGTVFGDAPLLVTDKKVSYTLKVKRVQPKAEDGLYCGITSSRPSLLDSIPPQVTSTPKSYLVGGKRGKCVFNGHATHCPLDLYRLSKNDVIQVVATRDGVLCVFLKGVMRVMAHMKLKKDFDQLYACAGLHGRAASIEIDTTKPIPPLFMKGWHQKFKSEHCRISYNSSAMFKGEHDQVGTGIVMADFPVTMHDGRIWFEFKIRQDSDTNYSVNQFIFGFTTTHPPELDGFDFTNILEIPEFFGIQPDGVYYHSEDEPVQLNWSKTHFNSGDEIGILVDHKNTMQLFVNGVYVLRAETPLPAHTPLYPVVSLCNAVPNIDYLRESLPPTLDMRKWSSVVFGMNIEVSPSGLSARVKSINSKAGNGIIGEAPLVAKYFEIEVVRIITEEEKDLNASAKKDEIGMAVGLTTSAPDQLGVYPGRLRDIPHTWVAGYGGSVFNTDAKKIDDCDFKLTNLNEGDHIGVSVHTTGHVVIYVNKIVEYSGFWQPELASQDLYALVDLGNAAKEIKFVKGAEPAIPFMVTFQQSPGIKLSSNMLVANYDPQANKSGEDVLVFGEGAVPTSVLGRFFEILVKGTGKGKRGFCVGVSTSDPSSFKGEITNIPQGLTALGSFWSFSFNGQWCWSSGDSKAGHANTAEAGVAFQVKEGNKLGVFISRGGKMSILLNREVKATSQADFHIPAHGALFPILVCTPKFSGIELIPNAFPQLYFLHRRAIAVAAPNCTNNAPGSHWHHPQD